MRTITAALILALLAAPARAGEREPSDVGWQTWTQCAGVIMEYTREVEDYADRVVRSDMALGLLVKVLDVLGELTEPRLGDAEDEFFAAVFLGRAALRSGRRDLMHEWCDPFINVDAVLPPR